MTNCPACGAPRDREDACDRCGAVWGATHLCPHCGGTTRAEPHRIWKFACAACGGPRLPDGMATKNADAALVRAKNAMRGVGRGRVASVLLAGVGVALAMTMLSAWATIGPALFVFAGVYVAGTLLARVAMSRSRKTAVLALGDAWALGVRARLARAPKGTTAKAVAEGTGLSEAEMNDLLTRLAVEEKVRVDVDDESAELRYRVDDEAKIEDAHELGDEDPNADETAEKWGDRAH